MATGLTDSQVRSLSRSPFDFIDTFALSIVAMAQRRVGGGLILLWATLATPVIGAFLAYSHATHLMKGVLEGTERKDDDAVSAPPGSEPGRYEIATEPEAPSAPSAALPGTATNKRRYPELDAANGFRDYHLGAPFSSFASVKLTEGRRLEGDEKLYHVQDFEKRLGDAELLYINLEFRQDLLKSVSVATRGEQNQLGLKEALIAAYGQPEIVEGFFGHQLVWNGEKTQLVFQLLLGDVFLATFESKEATAPSDEHAK